MKRISKLTLVSSAALMIWGLSACSNDINDANLKAPDRYLNLVHAPDVTAWSGNHFFNTNTRSNFTNVPVTRAEDGNNGTQGSLTWDFSEFSHEDEEWFNYFDSPYFYTEKDLQDNPEAIDITSSSFDRNNYSNYKIFYIPSTYKESEKGPTYVNINNIPSDGGFYNFGEISTLPDIGFNGAGHIYNDGTIENFDYSKGERHMVYNKGSLKVTSYNNIGYIYNYGDLTFQSSADIPNSMNIYSLGDIYMPYGGDFKAFLDLHGTLYSGADLSIQNNNDQYLCAIEVDGDLLIPEGGLHTSYIKANLFSFDGAEVWLLPQSLIDVKTLKMTNSGTDIKSAQDSYAFIRTEDVVFQNNNNFDNIFGPDIFFAVTGTIKLNGDNDAPMSLEEFVASEEGAKMKHRFQPTEGQLKGESTCGGDWEITDGTLEDDGPSEDICDKCKHPEHGDDPCDDCLNQDNHTPCDPCPNASDTDPDGCGHANHLHKNGKCSKCENEGIYNDCNPEPETPVVPEEPTECPNKGKEGYPEEGCDHPHTGPYCDICDDEDGPCQHPASTPGVRTGSEVEVNLSILDEHDKYTNEGISDFVAKLSIHVRVGGDVEVFIPIPAENYVANDDIVILNTHEPGYFIHGGPYEVAYPIGNNTVKLTLSYEDNGIRVTTDAIDDEVFKYCVDNYGDGINFEVWIYTNNKSGLNFTTFHDMLDRATIEFLDEDKEPDFYINAFNDTEENPRGYKDCDVNIIENQQGDYPTSEVGIHLNASSLNKIWRRSGHQGEIIGHDHIFLWGENNNK